jgi:hypothetical protein
MSWPMIERYRDCIAAQLRAGVTAATIHQRLRDLHGLTASVASLSGVHQSGVRQALVRGVA